MTALWSSGSRSLPSLDDRDLEFARALPKVELHCHIEGTMRPQTARELADKYGAEMPKRMADNEDAVSGYDSLNDFLSDFWVGQSLLRNRGDWERLAFEAVTDAAAQGVRYCEFFFTPARHLEQGQELLDIVLGLTSGLDQGENDTGTQAMLICDMDRAYGPSAGQRLIDELSLVRTDRVIGVGMDSTELGVDPLDYAWAFRSAKRRGFRLTSHAGEDTGPDNIAAVLSMGVERIDHGLSVMQDPELVRRVVDEGIPFTVCPSSNVLIANKVPDIASHPLRAMWEAGIRVSVNTDDPGYTGIGRDMEYALLLASGWSRADVASLTVDAIDGTWLDDEDRRKLRQVFVSHLVEHL